MRGTNVCTAYIYCIEQIRRSVRRLCYLITQEEAQWFNPRADRLKIGQEIMEPRSLPLVTTAKMLLSKALNLHLLRWSCAVTGADCVRVERADPGTREILLQKCSL